MKTFITLLLIGVLILGIVYVIENKPQDTIVNIFGDGQNKIVSKDLTYRQLTFNNINLEDSTVQDKANNICTASKLGMNVIINPCIANTITGKDITQYVTFTWNGTTGHNISAIFVYTGKLESAAMQLKQNRSYTYNGINITNAWINNYLVDKVTSYTSLGNLSTNVSIVCEIGNYNNTKAYKVSRTGFNDTVYCFTNISTINATAFYISGNYDNKQNFTETRYKEDYNDISNQISDITNSVPAALNKNWSFYQVQNVPFATGQTYNTKWVYTPKDREQKGKWHILLYDASIDNLYDALNNNHYLYIDPWWNNSCTYKVQYFINTTNGTSIGNLTVPINVTNETGMNSAFTDWCGITDAEDDNELGYWFYNNTVYPGNYAPVRVLMNRNISSASNTSVYVYFGNSVNTTKSNISNAYLFGDDFLGSGVDFTNKWQSNAQSQYTIGQSGILNISPQGTSWNNLLNTKITFNNYIVEARVYPVSPSSTLNMFLEMNPVAMTSKRADGASFRTSSGAGFYNVLGAVEQDVAGASANWYHIIMTIPAAGGGSSNTTDDNLVQKAAKTGTPSDRTQYIGLFSYAGAAYVDWVYARTYYDDTQYKISKGTATANGGTLTINLNSPATSSKFNVTSIGFNYTLVPQNANITNWTLSVWYSNGTLFNSYSNTTANVNATLNVLTTLNSFVDNSYIWGVSGCALGSNTICSSSSNNTLTVDLTKPSILVNTPNGDNYTFSMPYNITLNITSSDVNLGACQYYTNENITPNILTCNTTRLITFNNSGLYNIIYIVNDTFGNQNTTNISYLIDYIRSLVNYTATVIEGDTSIIYFNITADNITTKSANVSYNNTLYPMTLISSNLTSAAFSVSVTAPSVLSTSIINLSINYTVNGYNFLTQNYSQTINDIGNITTGCANPSLLFTLKDEEDLSNISGSYEYNFLYGTNTTQSLTYGSTSGYNLSICVNTTISPNWTVTYGEVVYKASNYYDRRYYVFNGTILNNVTQRINLYALKLSSGTSFQLTVQDPSLKPYENIYTELIRWYPAQNAYNIVDMGKTDNKGQTVVHVKTEDVDYRIGAYYPNGTLIRLADPIRMVCTSSPCTYDLNVNPDNVDYTSFLGVQQSLTYNESTGIWNYIYSDPSGKTKAMNLTIYKDTGTTSYIVCTSTTSGSVGAISCNTSIYNEGTLRAEVYRDDPIPIAQKIVNLISSPFTSSLGLWLSILVGIPVIIVFVFVSPIGALVGGIIALIPAFYFGSINIAILGGFAVLAGIVGHFLKRL